MTSITTKTIKGKKYKYFKYNYREGNETKDIEMSIRANGDLEQQKERFVVKVVNQRWVPAVDKIKNRYQEDLSRYTFTTKEKFFEDFGIRFTHHTSKIEGNTLGYRDVVSVILNDATPNNRPISDVEEIQAHIRIYREMLNSTENLTLPLILKWHQTLFGSSNPQIAGEIRNSPVFIAGSNYVPPASRFEVDFGLDNLFRWYNTNRDTIHPVLLACIVKFRFVSVHPFDDGNGRISRVIMNYLLHQAGYPMFNIEFKIRKGYFNVLEAANLKEDELRFVHWFFTHYIKSSQRYLEKM